MTAKRNSPAALLPKPNTLPRVDDDARVGLALEKLNDLARQRQALEADLRAKREAAAKAPRTSATDVRVAELLGGGAAAAVVDTNQKITELEAEIAALAKAEDLQHERVDQVRSEVSADLAAEHRAAFAELADRTRRALEMLGACVDAWGEGERLLAETGTRHASVPVLKPTSHHHRTGTPVVFSLSLADEGSWLSRTIGGLHSFKGTSD